MTSGCPCERTRFHESSRLRAGRIATACFGILQVGIAVGVGVIGTTESTVFNVLKIAGFATGPVLGLFMLASLTPPRSATGGADGLRGRCRGSVGGCNRNRPLLALVRRGRFHSDLVRRLVDTMVFHHWLPCKRRQVDDEACFREESFMRKALVNGRVFDGDELHAGLAVVLKDDRIDRTGAGTGHSRVD